jgi:pseudaminic acid biosynthesis-associated methylase
MNDDDEARRLEALWSGSFGDEYVERNFDDGSGRTPFWSHVLEVISPRTVLEVGCNVGGNLRCLAGLLEPENLTGVDVNEAALAALAADAPEIRTELTPARSLPFEDGSFDLVFTTGVLIHQPPETLPAVIDEIVRCSARYVVCGEYFADALEEVPYRGHSGALFRGDFGALYTERGLEVLERGFLPRDGVWDDLTYWILAKHDH